MAFVALSVVFAGCGGGTDVQPPATVARTGGDQQQGPVNVALGVPLSVRVTAADGRPLQGVTVTWVVTAGGGTVSPASSATDANGVATTNWTLGPMPGQQAVTASIEGGSSTTFTAVASAALACGPDVTLNVGGLCLASPERAANLNVNGGSAGGEFVAIPYYDGNLARTPITVSGIATGATVAGGPPTPTVAAGAMQSINANAALMLRSDLGFERALRRRERESLRPLVSSAGLFTGGGARLSVTPVEPRLTVVGDILTLNANAQQACTSPDLRQGVVRHISANAIWVEDTGNPTGGFTTNDYNEMAAAFENHIWPTDIAAFGTTTDIDQNGRVIIFFTIRVNELTPADQPSSFIGGFFFSRDLFPKTANEVVNGRTLGPCAGSNFAEMFYLLAPDPEGDHSAPRDVGFVKRVSPGTIAHELQHLINSSRRLRVIPNSTWPEVVWMEEGLSHIAEELVYYKVTGFSPRRNLSRTDILASQPLIDALLNYQFANLGRLSTYMRTTHNESPYGETPQPATGSSPEDWDDLETRGAIWSFLRWAADHRGNTDGDTWMQLANNPVVGISNLRDVFGADIGGRLREWAAATYIDDAQGVPQTDPTFLHPSWDFRTALLTVGSNNNVFPLAVHNIAEGQSTFTLVDGGAAYLRFGVPAGGNANVRITMSGAQLPPGASVWFVRTK
ncbi:MAG TPA: Ig-like domain-containing protein [Gemmatimonadaceae bacterium]|nr:Ig-like domain-containing protein [Gemmatimonadaceae bacterium]